MVAACQGHGGGALVWEGNRNPVNAGRWALFLMVILAETLETSGVGVA